MSNETNNQPPQYIITTPSETDAEEERSLNESETGQESQTAGTVVVHCETSSQQQQRRVVSQMSRQIASRSFSIASASNTKSILEEGSSSLDAGLQQQLQQLQSQQQQQVFASQKTISTSTRSQSLQSSSVTGNSSELALQIPAVAGTSLTTTQLGQQLKAQSSTSITTSEQRVGFMQKTASTCSTSSTKSKFQSFLQQPEAVAGHPGSSSGTFLTAHQKHVRQFVRSTSAHSEAAVSMGSSSVANRPDKCIRSASTQIDEPSSISMDSGNGDHLTVSTNKLGLHQSSSILISKSAETIEMKSSQQRTQLTLSGGLLAPPNRKITILSPIHAPPGLHDMLKRAGRSPLSPRISFPGSEADLFG